MQPKDDKFRSLIEILGARLQSLVISASDRDHAPKDVGYAVFVDDCVVFNKKYFHVKLSSDLFFNAKRSWIKQDQVQWLKSALLHELSHTRYAIRTIFRQSWGARRAAYKGKDHWLHLLLNLVQQVESSNLKLDSRRLSEILQLAEIDSKRSYQLLAAAFQRALAIRAGKLQRHLRFLAKLLALFHSILRLSFSVRNLISSQRSWFLHHGAHPSEVATLPAQGCFQRVCFSAA